MAEKLAFATEAERKALAAVAHGAAGLSSIQRVVAFGSRVRGDFRGDSDLDVLVIVDSYDHQIDRLVTRTASRVSLEYDTLINTHIVTAARWAEMRQRAATLWREVQRDGVPLLPELVSA